MTTLNFHAAPVAARLSGWWVALRASPKAA